MVKHKNFHNISDIQSHKFTFKMFWFSLKSSTITNCDPKLACRRQQVKVPFSATHQKQWLNWVEQQHEGTWNGGGFTIIPEWALTPPPWAPIESKSDWTQHTTQQQQQNITLEIECAMNLWFVVPNEKKSASPAFPVCKVGTLVKIWVKYTKV